MDVNASSRDRLLTLYLKGDLDHHGATGLMDRLDREIDAALPLQLVLDMEGVGFMDSSGIAVVMRCRRRMRELGGTAEVRGGSAQARKVLEAAGIDRFVTIR